MFSHRLRYLFIILLGVYSFLNIKFTEGDKLFGFEINTFVFFAIILILVGLIWEGNRLLNSHIFNPNPNSKLHPLIFLFIASILMVGLIAVVSTYSMGYFIGDQSHEMLTLKLTLGFGFRVNLFLHCVNAIYFFINRYNHAQLYAERLKKDHAEAQFTALRNQINPHFLFNSFNVLSSLIYKDTDTASKFIDQLSTVYRYLLHNQQNKIVSLRDELAFLDSYIFLLKIRFQNNLSIEVNIDEKHFDTYIAPATLQLLIENAIKHNVVSKAHPLHIQIVLKDGFIRVENSLKPKEIKEESTGLGLNNIKRRYDYLCGENAIITNSNGVFSVKIPVIDTV